MSQVLANLLVLWAFIISPVLCVSGILPNPCGDSECCDLCSDCVPHTPFCAEDSCHLVVAPLVLDLKGRGVAAVPDNCQVPPEAPPAGDANTPATQVLSITPCPERAPPSPLGLSFSGPLLI